MNSEKDTLPNNQVIFDAIKELQNEIKSLRSEMNKKFEQIDNRDELVRLQMLSFDVQLDRLVGSVSEVKSVAHNTRADVNIMRAEMHACSKEARELQLKVA